MTNEAISQIINTEVCQYFNLTDKQLKSVTRQRVITEPRYISFYFHRAMTGLSLNEIGRMFGKDHASVLHGIRTCEDLIKYNGLAVKTTVIAENIDRVIQASKREARNKEIEHWSLSIAQF